MPSHPAHPPRSTFHTAVISAGIVVWLLVLGYGFHRMVSYSLHPGEKQPSVTTAWPTNLPFKHSETGDTLVITLHPECACSTATLTELSRIVTARPDLKVFAIFENYDTLPEKLEDSKLWRQAVQIPGVATINDESGTLAGILGSKTSGEVHLFNSQGELLFRGGITGSRGHVGANPGSDAVLSLVDGESSTPQLEAPTFGCPLEQQN